MRWCVSQGEVTRDGLTCHQAVATLNCISSVKNDDSSVEKDDSSVENDYGSVKNDDSSEQ